MFIINGRRTVVYSDDVYVGGKFEHQRVFTHGGQNLSTFNDGSSVHNVHKFVKDLDPAYRSAEIFHLIFPCIETPSGNYTLDRTKKIPNLAYQKSVFDMNDLSIEEFHYLITRYNEMRGAISKFTIELEQKRIIER